MPDPQFCRRRFPLIHGADFEASFFSHYERDGRLIDAAALCLWLEGNVGSAKHSMILSRSPNPSVL